MAGAGKLILTLFFVTTGRTDPVAGYTLGFRSDDFNGTRSDSALWFGDGRGFLGSKKPRRAWNEGVIVIPASSETDEEKTTQVSMLGIDWLSDNKDVLCEGSSCYPNQRGILRL